MMKLVTTVERIERLVADHPGISGPQIGERLGLTRQAVNRHVKRLIEEGRVAKSGSTRNARYRVVGDGRKVETALPTFAKAYLLDGLEEDRVFRELELFLSLRSSLSAAAFESYHYAFTEILNNAIEHSKAAECSVSAAVGPYDALFTVVDRGIGIFRSVADAFALSDEALAVVELSKGKRTSQPERHSGEGIFFTSKCADRLEIASHALRLLYDNKRQDVFVETAPHRTGTTVAFSIARRAKRKLASIFADYAPEDFDYRFERTRVRVSLLGERYVSRSEARRLLTGVERFREVVLDFAGVRGIGQGFADEVFRVFAASRPDLAVRVENANDLVLRMIDHASRRAHEG